MGILVTWFFVPDMTGRDLADVDADFMRYLEANGWQGDVGEDDDDSLVKVADVDGRGSEEASSTRA